MRHDDNRAWADANVAVIPMIETAEAIENLDEILSVPGVDAIYVGPADLSISLGLEPVRQRRQRRCSTTRWRRSSPPASGTAWCRASTPPGRSRRVRREQGFRMITVTSDALAIRAGYTSELAAARGARVTVRRPAPSLY